MTAPLFGRPGSYPPVCQSPGTCNQGRNCTCGPRRVDNEPMHRACDRVCLAVAIVLACIGVAEVLSRSFGG